MVSQAVRLGVEPQLMINLSTVYSLRDYTSSSSIMGMHPFHWIEESLVDI
jgi:hypothetical protein